MASPSSSASYSMVQQSLAPSVSSGVGQLYSAKLALGEWSGMASAASGGDVVLSGVIGEFVPWPETINFPTLPNLTFAPGEQVTLSGTVSSGLPLLFSVLSGPATLNGAVLTITGPGVVSVVARQSGNADFQAAMGVTNTFTVTSALPPVVSLSPVGASGANQFVLSIFATAGVGVVVETSIDLVTWTKVTTVLGQGFQTSVNVTTASLGLNGPAAFLRCVAP